MKIIYERGQLKKLNFKNPVLAIGIFDGVHLGHQLVIKRTVEEAKRINGTSIVLTFFPHPQHILKPGPNLALLIPLEERLRLINELKVDVCIVVNFTKNFAAFSAEDFVRDFIINKIKPLVIFVGADFNFGKDRQGDVEMLSRMGILHGFETVKIAPLKILGMPISSTLIRKLINKCEFAKASLFLGRPISVLGKVIKGKGLGRILGFPTANIVCLNQAIPPAGVYAVKVILKKRKLLGMVFNIGLQQPNKKKLKANLEVHIFDFCKNLYGRELNIEFYEKIRSVKKFKKQDSLIKQIEEDAKRVKKFFLHFKLPPNSS